ncbi:MAG: TGB3 protein [Xinjiang sediment betaflexivirus 1]|nr:MAG: TGB3 protein [Xinjiang sediment betaflexivirus 1]
MLPLTVKSCCCLAALSFACVFGLLNWFAGSDPGCTVILTGESVKLLNCKFTPEFIDYASKLNVLRV